MTTAENNLFKFSLWYFLPIYRSLLETVTILLQFWIHLILLRPDTSKSLSLRPAIHVWGLNCMAATPKDGEYISEHDLEITNW